MALLVGVFAVPLEELGVIAQRLADRDENAPDGLDSLLQSRGRPGDLVRLIGVEVPERADSDDLCVR